MNKLDNCCIEISYCSKLVEEMERNNNNTKTNDIACDYK